MADQLAAGEELLDWDSADVHPEVVSDAMLVVRGVAPVPMEVELRSLPIPIVAEEYHGVLVVGRRPEAGPEVETPWTAQIQMSEASGTKGIELIGKTKRERFPPS